MLKSNNVKNINNYLKDLFKENYKYNEQKNKLDQKKQRYFTSLDLFTPFLPDKKGNKLGIKSLEKLETMNPELTVQLKMLYNLNNNDVCFSKFNSDNFQEQMAKGLELMITKSIRDNKRNKISNVPFNFLMPGSNKECDYRYFVQEDMIHYDEYSLGILPVSWWNSPTYKKPVFDLLCSNGLAGIYYHGDKSVFEGIDSTIQTCTVFLKKGYQGPVRYIDLNRKIDTMIDLSKFNLVPKLLDRSTPDILEKLIKAKGFSEVNTGQGKIKGPNKQKKAPVGQVLTAWKIQQSNDDVKVLDRVGEFVKGNINNAILYTSKDYAKGSIFYDNRTCCFRYNFGGPLKSVVNKPQGWATSIGVWNIRPYEDTDLAQNQTNQILTGPINSYILSCVKYFSGSFNHEIEKQMVDVPDSLKSKKQWSPEEEVNSPEFNLNQSQQKIVLDHYYENIRKQK